MVKVIDVSVAIKWMVEEDGRDQALGILRQLMDNPREFAVPELFFFELAAVFGRLVPSPSLRQLTLLGKILTLGLQRFSMTAPLLEETLRMQRRGLSGYDGAYVALAKILKGKWLTFDRKAHAAVEPLRLSILVEP